jgi:hypothetical protein
MLMPASSYEDRLPQIPLADSRFLQHRVRRVRPTCGRSHQKGADLRGCRRADPGVYLPRDHAPLQPARQRLDRAGAGPRRSDRHPSAADSRDGHHSRRDLQDGRDRGAAVHAVRRRCARVPTGPQRHAGADHRPREPRQDRDGPREAAGSRRDRGHGPPEGAPPRPACWPGRRRWTPPRIGARPRRPAPTTRR